MSPLPLPQCTFLLGPTDLGQTELSHAIAERNLTMAIEDFDEPVYATMHLLTLGHMVMRDDFPQTIPLTDIPSSFYFISYRHFIEEHLGRDYLARNALSRILEFDHYPQYLFRDARGKEDILPFIDHYGEANCLAIALGELTSIDVPCESIWLPHNPLAERMRRLESELAGKISE